MKYDRTHKHSLFFSVDPSLQNQSGARLTFPRGEWSAWKLCTFGHVCFARPLLFICSLFFFMRVLQMSLIFSAGSLADVHPPCVLQSFVSHGAVLHKVFVVGDRHFCVERPSLKNFPSGPCGQSAPDQQKYKIYTLYALYTYT